MPRRGRGSRGGARTPSAPAQHSGPGASSSRTDGQPLATRDTGSTAGGSAPDPPAFPASRYGGRQTTQRMQQQGSPPGQHGTSPGGASPGGGGPSPGSNPGSRPGTRAPFDTPDTPPADGRFADLPRTQPQGPSPEAITQRIDMATVAPALPILEALSQRPAASSTLRNTVRRLRAQVPGDFDLSDAFTRVATGVQDALDESEPAPAEPVEE